MTLPSYQQFGAPPPRRNRPWLWALAGAAVGSAATIAAGLLLVVVLAVVGVSLLPGDYIVDDPDVTAATEQPCERLDATARALPRFAGPAAGAAALDEVRDAVDEVGDAVEGTGASDDASVAWRRDLADLSDRLTAYREALASGDQAPPDLGGASGLLERLDAGSPVGCEVPFAVSSLDPDYEGYLADFG